MFVPFLFELRAVMDWIWTDTSMSIMDWFKMEDVFASIYQIKVSSVRLCCSHTICIRDTTFSQSLLLGYLLKIFL